MPLALTLPEQVSLGQPVQKLIFIVEDEPEIGSLIAHTLANADFAVKVFDRGQSVIEALSDQLPALVLLDQMLPDMNGLEVLRLIEQDLGHQQVKTIVISAHNTETDKVRALELGADDYVSKPFSPRELVARVRAVLRSAHRGLAHCVLQRGRLLADLDSRKLMVDGRESICSVTEFDLLTYFMRHTGQTLSRRHLLEKLWAANWHSIDSRVIDVYIHRLRQKIEPDPANPTHLVTRRGGGYALIFPEVPTLPSEG
jgi:DNA-binding response OmpR family regulator